MADEDGSTPSQRMPEPTLEAIAAGRLRDSSAPSGAAVAEWERFFNMSPDLLGIAGFDGYFKHLNPSWTRALGYSLEELKAKPFLSFVHPDDVPLTVRASERAMQGGAIDAFINRYRAKDGSYRSLEWVGTGYARHQLIYALARDVTEREHQRKERLAVEARLRHLLSSSPIAIYSRAPGGDFELTFVSDSITELLGYEPRELMGRADAWEERVSPRDQALARSMPAEVIARGQERREYRVTDKHGEVRWIHDHCKLARDEGGNLLELVGSWQDITDRKHAELTIREQAAALTALSTPLIPISKDIVVMPLIGAVDAKRADQVLSTLLDGIVKQRARVAILDITGVGAVDASVADALVRASRAVELLGARVVLTGIRPDMAQALVALDEDLGGVTTRSTLEAGIAFAMR